MIRPSYWVRFVRCIIFHVIVCTQSNLCQCFVAVNLRISISNDCSALSLTQRCWLTGRPAFIESRRLFCPTVHVIIASEQLQSRVKRRRCDPCSGRVRSASRPTCYEIRHRDTLIAVILWTRSSRPAGSVFAGEWRQALWLEREIEGQGWTRLTDAVGGVSMTQLGHTKRHNIPSQQ